MTVSYTDMHVCNVILCCLSNSSGHHSNTNQDSKHSSYPLKGSNTRTKNLTTVDHQRESSRLKRTAGPPHQNSTTSSKRYQYHIWQLFQSICMHSLACSLQILIGHALNYMQVITYYFELCVLVVVCFCNVLKYLSRGLHHLSDIDVDVI